MKYLALLRSSAFMTLVACCASTNVSGQSLPYDRTVFLSGLNSPYTWWGTAALSLDAQLDLGTVVVPNINTLATITNQSSAVQSLTGWGSSGKAVLIGHSMGGLVGRRIAVDDSARVFGLVTVGTPVRGARVTSAARIGLLTFRVQDAINRVGDVFGVFGQRQAILNGMGLTNGAGNIISTLLPSSSAGWGDLQQNSTAVQATYSGTGPSIGLAQVIGEVPQAGVHYRLIASVAGTPGAWTTYRTFDHVFRATCRTGRVVGYISLVGFSLARKCGFAIHTLEKIDVAFVQAVKGQTVLQSWLYPKAFDGIVAADDAAWIGWGSPAVFTVVGVDHVSLQYSSQAIDKQRLALIAVLVVPR